MMEPSQKYRNHRSRWTIRELHFVEEHYGKLPAQDIADQLGRSINGIRRVVHLLGLGNKSVGPWTEAEIALLHSHYKKGAGLGKIQSLLPGRTRAAIAALACKLGITGRESWSASEKRFLKEHYGKMPTRKIAATLGRSVSAVRVTVNQLSLGKKSVGPWTEEEMAVLSDHYDRGLGITYVQSRLPGRTKGAIRAQASKMDLTGRRPWQPYEDIILREFYPELGSSIISKLPHRTLPAIKHQAKKLGLRYRR
ncbi:hypothetical protein [Serratia sp. DD3]|uniref:hypothetical protein n=1 Tax=Serratia sp. DD3 TaxID=1410619 RepID=UPI0003C52082|nr:hypothetical protein [Serratia sp. DD3]KEY59559.1 GcrA cell cycle regulator [Serratia sp. DD3]